MRLVADLPVSRLALRWIHVRRLVLASGRCRDCRHSIRILENWAEGELDLGEIMHKGEKVTVKIKVVRGE